MRLIEGVPALSSPRSLVLAALFFAGLVSTAQAPVTLKGAYNGLFHIGAAINEREIMGTDTRGDAILESNFDSISPENILKFERVHPGPDKYNFDLPDKYVAFGEKNHMFIVGHTLVWHAQTPAWVFQGENGQPADRETLLKRLHDHISTVVGRYKGRIQAWDVVNEALNDDGTLRQSPWLKIIGDDYIVKAFQFAHEADPQAQLNYNDYSLENEPKRNGAIALVKQLQAAGIPITTVGIQGHDSLDWPSAQLEDETISAFAKLGVKVAITELDIDVLPRGVKSNTADVGYSIKSDPKLNPYPDTLPDAQQLELAHRYADLFAVYVKHADVINRVTLWGVTDSDSWLNNWPVRGRTSYPLLFYREGKPKPAFDAVIRVAGKR
jgi:endo-1,4-beta-xylanase